MPCHRALCPLRVARQEGLDQRRMLGMAAHELAPAIALRRAPHDRLLHQRAQHLRQPRRGGRVQHDRMKLAIGAQEPVGVVRPAGRLHLRVQRLQLGYALGRDPRGSPRRRMPFRAG